MLKEDFEFQSERLSLRFFKEDDLSRWQKLFSNMNPKKNQWDWEIENIKDLSLKRFQNKIKIHKLERNKGNLFYFCVEEKYSQDLIGIAIINNIDYELSIAEIGFQLNNKYWDLGYGNEIAKSLIKIVNEVLKIIKLYTLVNSKNYKSIRIMEKLNFIPIEFLENGQIKFEKF